MTDRKRSLESGCSGNRIFVCGCEPIAAGIEHFIGGDSEHHFDALGITEVDGVIGGGMADDIMIVLVWSNNGWLGRA